MADNIDKNVNIIFKLIDSTRNSTKTITNNLGKIKNSVKTVNNDVANLGKKFVTSMEASKYSIDQVAIAAAGLGAAIVVPFGFAIKEAAEFEEQMSAVKAISGATSEEFKALTDIALTMGRETRYSAAQSAEALRFMSMAGLEAKESIGALPSVLQLATAGNLDLGVSADIATNIMTAYGFAADDLTMVNDRLVTAFTSSNSTLQELGEGFKYVGPIAKGMGAEFDDPVSSLAQLHNAGIKGSMAGTTLRGTLSALYNPTNEEAKLLKVLSDRIGGVGLQIKNSEGDFVGFESLVRQLEDSGITAGEALELFGLRAGPGMVALLEQGSDSLAEFNSKMAGSQGTAENIAKIMDENFTGAMRRAGSAISGLAIAIGNNFIPLLTVMADAFATVIVKLTEFHDFLGPIATVIETLVITFGGLILILGVASLAFTTFIAPIGAAITELGLLAGANGVAIISLGSLSTALRATAASARSLFVALGPIGWVLIGLAAAVTATIGFLNKAKRQTDELIQAHKEQAVAIDGASKSYERYQKTLKDVAFNSERALQANLKHREELKKVIADFSIIDIELKQNARTALESIHSVTGYVTDGGKALLKYQQSLAALDFKNKALAITEYGKKLADLAVEHRLFGKTTSKSWDDIIKEVKNYGKAGKKLTEDEEEIKAAFNGTTQAASNLIDHMVKVGKIDFKDTKKDAQALYEASNILVKSGFGALFSIKAAKQAYKEQIEANKKAIEAMANDDEKSALDRATAFKNNYEKVIKESQRAADEFLLIQKEITVKELSNDKLSAKQREKIIQESSREIEDIELEKYEILEQYANDYLDAVRLTSPGDIIAIQKAEDSAIKASNKVREVKIRNTMAIDSNNRKILLMQLKRAEENLELQRQWALVESEEAMILLESEYAQKLISSEQYWSKRKSKIEESQADEIAHLQSLHDLATTSTDKDRISREIAAKKIEQAKELNDLLKQEKNDKKAIADLEKAALQELHDLKKALEQEDPETSELDKLKARQEEEERIMNESFQRQLELYKKLKFDQDVIADLKVQQDKKRLAVKRKHQEEYYLAIAEMSKKMANQVSSTFRALYEATGKKNKELFYIMKAAAIAEATISALVAANTASKQQPPWLGMTMSALILAKGMANVAIITQQKMAAGGWVGGQSPSDKADNIPVMLTAKEYVMPVAVGRKYGPRIMDAFRAGMFDKTLLSGALGNAGDHVPRAKSGRRLAEGGMVSGSGMSNAGMTNVKIVNLVDPSLFERYTSSDEGKQSIINVISDKSSEVNYALSNS